MYYKQFYYYQRRIRAIIAAQAEQPTLSEGNSGLTANFVERQSNCLQIVKLRLAYI